MNRNKSVIRSNDQVLQAARTLYLIVKVLKLNREQWDDMYTMDVFNKIETSDIAAADKHLLKAFAYGVQQVYVTILITEHCEFVYQLANGEKVGVKEATRKGPAALEGATCCHQWKDSEFEFTSPQLSIDLWI